MGDLSGAVWAEIHKDNRIAIFDCYRALTRASNGGGLHKLIVLVSGIGSLQCAYWV